MREIKFRGESYNPHKPDEKGEWVYGFLSYSEQMDRYYIGVSELMTPVKKGSVGQWTGLKDRNGVEIYEGDKVNVLEYLNGKIWEGHCHEAIVIYSVSRFTFDPCWRGQGLGRNEVEVITEEE